MSMGGDASIKIADEAYLGDSYIKTAIESDQLEAKGWSSINKYYANFIGVLQHERQHAQNEVAVGGVSDPDGDYLSNDFELATSSTDPNGKYSARGVLSGSAWDDGEVYAGGPVEKNGILGADTSSDWANPGTNKL